MTKQVIDTDGLTEITVADNTPVMTRNGVHYMITTTEQTALDTEATAYAEGADDRQKDVLRVTRQPLLQEADIEMFKLQDAGSSTTTLSTYRQDLRDVTDQADIYSVSWPTKPF